MTLLRQRMIEDMQLRGLAARTQEAYVAAVEQLAKHYHRSPDEIGEQELRQYLLCFQNEKSVSASTTPALYRRQCGASVTVALCVIKFLYQHVKTTTEGSGGWESGGAVGWATEDVGGRVVVDSADVACEGAVDAGIAAGTSGDAVFGGGANTPDAVG
jgi:hypothetical protein